MSKNMAIDEDGNIIWCNWRKPLNASSFVRDNRFSAEWQGCSNTALQSVPSGVCDRLFDPERLKLCKGSIIGGGQGTLGGAAIGGGLGGVPGAIAGTIGGTIGVPAVNSVMNREACTAKTTLDWFGHGADAYCAVPGALHNNLSPEIARKFGISCMTDDGVERTPTNSCYDVKNKNLCNRSWTTSKYNDNNRDGDDKVGQGIERPYMPCKWNESLIGSDICEIDTSGTPCRFDESIMVENNDSNFSWLKSSAPPGETYTACDYNEDKYNGIYDPECPPISNPPAPILSRQKYDFEPGTQVIYCGKNNNYVKCSDDPKKVDALIEGDESELATCPQGYVEVKITEDLEQDDDCVGLDIMGVGWPCRYRECQKEL
jgi:hypothetical protein